MKLKRKLKASNGRQREATGGNRGQFPRTDFGQGHGISSSNNAARIPKATLVWRMKCYNIYSI